MARLFLAINIPDDVRVEIARAQEEARRRFRHSRVTWVAPENFHVTLHFLGETSADMQARLIESLRAIEYPPAFDLRLLDIGAFPGLKDPKTLFVRCTTPTEVIGIRKRTADVLAGLGFAIDGRPWYAHVTIGRVKVRAESLQSETMAVEPIVFSVWSFEFMRSTFTPDGSIYERVESFTLSPAIRNGV